MDIIQSSVVVNLGIVERRNIRIISGQESGLRSCISTNLIELSEKGRIVGVQVGLDRLDLIGELFDLLVELDRVLEHQLGVQLRKLFGDWDGGEDERLGCWSQS